jgi:hypothetical protein
MSDYKHVSSLRDLDNEILKTQIKKEIIRKELYTQVEIARRSLTPAVIGLQIARTIQSKDASTSEKIIGIISKVLGGIEASKFGAQLIKKVLK